MRKPRRWTVILAVALIPSFVALWFAWPWITGTFEVHRLNGSPSGDDWNYSMNTYSDRISSAEVGGLFSKGSARLATLGSPCNTYAYEDKMGYKGCITVVQHPTSYEFVGVFGANDNDSISIGRASGRFPPSRYLKVMQIKTGTLPHGVIRPW